MPSLSSQWQSTRGAGFKETCVAEENQIGIKNWPWVTTCRWSRTDSITATDSRNHLFRSCTVYNDQNILIENIDCNVMVYGNKRSWKCFLVESQAPHALALQGHQESLQGRKRPWDSLRFSPTTWVLPRLMCMYKRLPKYSLVLGCSSRVEHMSGSMSKALGSILSTTRKQNKT